MLFSRHYWYLGKLYLKAGGSCHLFPALKKNQVLCNLSPPLTPSLPLEEIYHEPVQGFRPVIGFRVKAALMNYFQPCDVINHARFWNLVEIRRFIALVSRILRWNRQKKCGRSTSTSIPERRLGSKTSCPFVKTSWATQREIGIWCSALCAVAAMRSRSLLHLLPRKKISHWVMICAILCFTFQRQPPFSSTLQRRCREFDRRGIKIRVVFTRHKSERR